MLHNPIFYLMLYKQHFGKVSRTNPLYTENIDTVDLWFHYYLGIAGKLFLATDQMWWPLGLRSGSFLVTDPGH